MTTRTLIPKMLRTYNIPLDAVEPDGTIWMKPPKPRGRPSEWHRLKTTANDPSCGAYELMAAAESGLMDRMELLERAKTCLCTLPALSDWPRWPSERSNRLRRETEEKRRALMNRLNALIIKAPLNPRQRPGIEITREIHNLAVGFWESLTEIDEAMEAASPSYDAPMGIFDHWGIPHGLKTAGGLLSREVLRAWRAGEEYALGIDTLPAAEPRREPGPADLMLAEARPAPEPMPAPTPLAALAPRSARLRVEVSDRPQARLEPVSEAMVDVDGRLFPAPDKTGYSSYLPTGFNKTMCDLVAQHSGAHALVGSEQESKDLYDLFPTSVCENMRGPEKENIVDTLRGYMRGDYPKYLAFTAHKLQASQRSRQSQTGDNASLNAFDAWLVPPFLWGRGLPDTNACVSKMPRIGDDFMPKPEHHAMIAVLRSDKGRALLEEIRSIPDWSGKQPARDKALALYRERMAPPAPPAPAAETGTAPEQP